MYKGYIVDDFDECFDFDDIEESVTDGVIDLSEDQEHVYSVNEEFSFCLDKFILKGSVNKDLLLDGTKIINDYFPEIKADIFISHSHKDVKKAKQFANLIHRKTGLKSFIDSEVWQYADSLLKEFEINVANALLPENAIIESHENFSYMPEMTFEADLKRFEKVNVEAFLLQCGLKKTEDWNCENACVEEKFR